MRSRSYVATLLVVTLGVPWVLPTGAPRAVAATFTVTALVDAHDADLTDGVCDTGTGDCTLRAAIEQANHLGGSHEITLGPGVHRVGNNAGTVSPERIDVTADVTVVGSGREQTTVSLDSSNGSDIFRLLANSSLTISGLTLTRQVGSDWADGIVVSGDGASLFVDEVLFLGLGDTAVAAWGYGSDPDPADFDIWIEDSTMDGAGETYSLLAVSSGGAEIDIVRTEVHSSYYALLVDNDTASPAGDDLLRITDSVLDGSYWADDPENGIESYGNFAVELAGTTIRNHASGVRADSSRMTVTDSQILDNKYIGIWFSGWDDAAQISIDRTLLAGNAQSGLDIDGDLVLTNSTLTGNAAGGYTAFSLSDPALVENTTIADNDESGIYLPAGSVLRNVTIARNGVASPYDEPGLYVEGEITMWNSVVAGNKLDCYENQYDDPVVILGDHNVDGDGSCDLGGPNDQTGIDPLLGSLDDNGGPTPTSAPLAGSPLLDAGTDAECPATDQRGAARPFDADGDGTATCDIGAVEAGSEVLATTSVTWSGSQARRGMLAPDAPLTIEATSVPGGSAAADVTLSSWYPGGDTTAPIAGAPDEVVVPVALTEGAAGVYTGTLPLAGVAEITAIDVVVTEGGEGRAGSATSGLPVRVAGAVELTTDLGVPAWTLPSARAHLASAETADGDSLSIPVTGVTQTRWLRPSADYEVEVVDGQHRRVAPTVADVEVRAGLVTEVTIDDLVLPYVPFSLVVDDANDQPVADVKVTVTDQATGDQIVKATTGPDGRVEGVARGPDIAVAVDPLDQPYLAVDSTVTLTELEQQFTIEMGAALPTAVVSGIVDRSDRPPIPGARVSFVSQVGDRFFTTATTTGEDGTYSAVVFQGDVTIAVDEPRTGKASVTTAIAADATVDLELTGPLLIDVAVDLQTRYAGDPAPTPVDMDGTTGYHLRVQLKNGRQTLNVRDDTVTVPYHAGDTLQLCANGFEADLPAGCADAVVDTTTQTGTASLVLEQAGAITGGLTWTATSYLEEQTYRPVVVANVFRVDGTSVTKIDSVRPQLQTVPASGEVQLAELFAPLFDPGTYELRFELHEYVTTPCQLLPGGDPLCGERWVRSEYARVRTTVPVDGIVDVGTIPFTVPGRRFTSSVESNVTVSPDVLLPGDEARVRVSAHNGSVDTVDGAALVLDLPADTSLVPDSITVDGEPATGSVVDGVLTVPVGTVDPGQTVVATAWLDVAPSVDTDSLQVAGSIAYGATTEPLGSGAAIVRRLSVNSVERTAELDIPVWGRSFPGSTVDVTVDGAVLGTAVASPGGFWSTIVTLPEVPLPRTFAIAAHASGGAGSFTTPSHIVSYDESHPTLRRAVMQQSGGRVVEFDPRRGLAQFPYVFVPGQAIMIDLEFDRPFAIHPPTVWVGSRSAEAVYDTGTGLWRATMRPSFRELGEIRISWEPLPVVVDMAPDQPQEQLTVEETRAMLPADLRTFSDVQLTDPTPGAPVATATFPDVGDGGTTTEIIWTTESVEYSPTDSDLARQAASGVTMWDVQVERVEQLDGTVDLELSFVVPDDALNLDGPEPWAPRPQQAGAAASTLVKLAWKEMGNLEFAWKATDNVNAVSGNINSDEFLGKLDDVVGNIEGACSAGVAAPLLAEAEFLAELYMGTIGVNTAVMLIGIVAGPETLGLGTLASFGIAWLIDKYMAAVMDQELAQLKNKIKNQCTPDPDEDDEDDQQEEECAPEWALVPPSLGGPDCQPIADPTYVYDPSGFVYEVLEENRLEGVKATLETAPDANGPWTIWDAEWFLQQNPLTTDAEGRYAWDVPEGWWRVRWEKAGYETQYSDALEVLPPHFDVNADLRNLTAPSVSAASATAGGSQVEIVFDQYMDADFVTDESLAVAAPVGESWTVAALDGQTSGDGDPVATTFTIDLGRTLAEGEELDIEIDLAVRSASGVPIEPTTVDVTVEAAPPEPQTISFAVIGDVVYGAAPIAIAPSASSGLPVTLAAAGPCAVQGGTSVIVTGVGTCTLTASQGGNASWQAAADVVRAFAISPRPVTVTAHSENSTVGDAVPSFGATAVGLVAPDTIGSLGGLTCASAAPSVGGVLTTAGTFPVTCTGLQAPNYSVTYAAGTHTVVTGGGAPPPVATTVVPARLLETRRGEGLETVDHEFEGVGRVAARSVIEVDVAGRGGVPDTIGAVMLNVTAIRPAEAGYLTVYPCDEQRPLASNVNYATGQVIPNAVLAKVAGDGTVCIFTWSETDLVIDVNGYVPVGGSPDPVVPARLLETRQGVGFETVDGQFEGVGRVAAGTALEFQVGGRGGVPADAVAAMLNVTAVRPDDRGYLTVYPCDEERPLASNVNYLSPQVVPNAVLAKLSATGTVCIYTHATTDLVVDVNGYVPGGGSPQPVVPARVLETRAGLDTVDGRFEGGGRVAARDVIAVEVEGRAGVPDDVGAVMLNVTAVRPDAAGYLTVFPCDRERPLASNVNYTEGQVIPNAVLAKVAADGTVCIFTWAETDLVVDVNGYIP